METFRLYQHPDVTFVQDNLVQSVPHVLRGLHYRIGAPEGKLIHVVMGRIFDVVVDIRRSSPTFGRWYGTELSAINRYQLWVPPGFAHGYFTLTPALVAYKVTDYYKALDARAIRWDDPLLGIKWPTGGHTPILSHDDSRAPAFAVAELLP
jgi:dTDP-4-dehydrorhamnose 3,5-epimerase